jgi:hypothetical protein
MLETSADGKPRTKEVVNESEKADSLSVVYIM